MTASGDVVGYEKFGPPYDFFRRARLVKDSEDNYRIAFNMRIGNTDLFFAEMQDLETQVGKECKSEC